MLKELQDFGLSEKEARVYLASLEIGRATADQLAKHANIVRPTTYVQIKTLMEKGLMSTYEEGKKTYFTPESPSILTRLLEKQKENLRTSETLLGQLLPTLIGQFEGAGERPVVRYFPGKEGLTAIREEMLSTKEKKTFVIFSPKHIKQIFSDHYLDEYSDRRRALGIHSKGIYVNEEFFSRAGLDSLTERRYIRPDQLTLSIDVYVYDDKVAVISLEGALFGMIVQSKNFAESMKSIFNFLWLQAETGTEKK